MEVILPTYLMLTSLAGNQICCQVALHYLRSKPLGLQTFFDLVLKDFIRVYSSFSVHFMLLVLIGVWFNPTSIEFVQFMVMLNSLLFITLQFYGIVTLTTKYLSIFHSGLIHAINEERNILKWIRIGAFGFAAVYCSGIQLNDVKLPHFRPNENVVTAPPQVVYLHFVTTIFAIALQFRKELDYWRYRENSGIIYKLKKTERFTMIGTVILFLFLSFLFQNVFIRIATFVTYFLVTPLVYILSSENMKRHLLKFFPMIRTPTQPPIYLVMC